MAHVTYKPHITHMWVIDVFKEKKKWEREKER